jgi:HK97 family phage prohead protease
MERRETQDFNFKIKGGADDSGTFTGLAAVFNNVDLGGDMIVPGAFTRTLQASKGQVPMLWQHDPTQPIGTLQCTETSEGLRVQGKLLMKLPMAQDAYELIKAGVIKGLSIGYNTIDDAIENGVRMLKEVRLWEGSVVTFPMNEGAMISSIKGMSDLDRVKHIKVISDNRKQINRCQLAIRESLKCLGVDDEPDDAEPSENESDGDTSALLDELRALVAEASELAEA